MWPLKWVAALTMACVSVGHAAALTDADLEDCDVLIGNKKKAAFAKFVADQKKQADAGSIEIAMNYGGLQNNRLVCFEEKILGTSGWGMIVESQGTTQMNIRPIIEDIDKRPEPLAALWEVIAAYGAIADKHLSARMLAGEYYGRYHKALGEPEKGYWYLTSTYEAECGTINKVNKSRCTLLKQHKILFNDLLPPEKRWALDVKAKGWSINQIVK
ncbi:hypothetical protein [Chitinivorax sp. B]|uniref:hypothetical protein n=1 Tax=Chitinivorax sp. B TaxID=2502235 RepID=UPI0010F88313|nr:hypothetical protein [Chitinivorax sp. B]